MHRYRFASWLRKIYNTKEEEISCTTCFDLVSRLVDLELSGGDPLVEMPQVIHHLEQCGVCQEEYEILRDLRRMENEGKLPSIDELKDSIA